MASIFQLPQDITCCDAPNSSPDRPKGGFPVSDDVSSLGTTEQRKDPIVVQKLVTCEDLMTRAEHVKEDNCRETTVLYSAIENEKWENVLFFLETGKVPGYYCGLGGATSSPDSLDSRAQVHTWISRKDWWGSTTTRNLPIHAAVEHNAPIRLINKLIELHPEGARSQDLNGNLPLHLSFKHAASDSVISLLLKAFPEAVGVKNKEDRNPVDYASEDSGAIIKLCVEQTKKSC